MKLLSASSNNVTINASKCSIPSRDIFIFQILKQLKHIIIIIIIFLFLPFPRLFPQQHSLEQLKKELFNATYHSTWYGDEIFDKLTAEFLRLWRSANGETEPYAILRNCASLISPSPPLSLTSNTFPPNSSPSESSPDGFRKNETRREFPRAQEMERREIGGLRPWWRGKTAVARASDEKGTSSPVDEAPSAEADEKASIVARKPKFLTVGDECFQGFERVFEEKWFRPCLVKCAGVRLGDLVSAVGHLKKVLNQTFVWIKYGRILFFILT